MPSRPGTGGADLLASTLSDRASDWVPDRVPEPTPVLTYGLRVGGVLRRLHLKAEWHSPLGSVKGRTAMALLASVADRVDPRHGVIESTSGNLGVALARLCAARQIPFTAVIDPRTSRFLIDQMLAQGANVVESTVPDGRGGYLLSRLATVEDALRRNPKLVWTDQYHNPANPMAHAVGTAPELAAQVPQAQTVLVPVSTGGTLAGIRRYATEQGLPWRCVGVDVTGSAALGGVPAERVIPGIGASVRSTFLPAEGVDAEVLPADQALGACDWARARLGIGLGGSAGAAVAAAARRMHADPVLTEVVCICPDGADRYQSTLYLPSWRAEHGIEPTALDLEVMPAGVAW